MSDPTPREPEKYCRLLRLQASQIRLHPKLRARFDESDLVQDAITRAIERRDQFRGSTEGEYLRWLMEILNHAAIDRIRHEQAQARDPAREAKLEAAVMESTATWDAVLPDPGDPPPVAVEKRERLDRLAQALEQLPADQREAVTARELMGLTLAEIAERMGRSESSVSGLLIRGRKRLKQLMRPAEGDTDGTF